MADIKNLFHINAPVDKVYQALTTVDGLSKWWTTQTTGDSNLNGVIQFRFGGYGGADMKVTAMQPNDSVLWQCMAGAGDWIGTTISFKLDTNDGKTRVRFEHAGWKESDFFAACSFTWSRYMESLRQLCEEGNGKPFGG